jgi:crotonobetainyl-CoA:carnitine CoA-transferase CaiB-like acyl-CoA transferase
MTGEAPPPMPSRVSAWSVYDVFTLADGEQLFIGAVSDKQFQTLCRVLERPDLLDDPALAHQRAARGGAPAAAGALGAILRSTHRRAVAQAGSGRPALRAHRAARPAAARPAPAESGGLVPMQTDEGGTTDVVLLPLLMGGRGPACAMPLPKIGEHTDPDRRSVSDNAGVNSQAIDDDPNATRRKKTRFHGALWVGIGITPASRPIP